jgi:hypothetical protein
MNGDSVARAHRAFPSSLGGLTLVPRLAAIDTEIVRTAGRAVWRRGEVFDPMAKRREGGGDRLALTA